MASAASDTPAHLLSHLPDATQVWPFADGKGCFGKDRQGKELPFLERLFLLLAFPNLELPGQPGRTLGEAIRWKQADELPALGLPAGTAAFEIVDVPLVEAAVYPQYASGSFNKTCAKWGLYSPITQRQARCDPTKQTGAPSERLRRECICVPLEHRFLPQLVATATAADVYRRAALVAPPPASSTPAVAPGRKLGAAAAAAPSTARAFGAAPEEAKTKHGAQLPSAADRVIATAEATRAVEAVKSQPPLKSILKKNGRFSGYHAMSILGWTSA